MEKIGIKLTPSPVGRDGMKRTLKSLKSLSKMSSGAAIRRIPECVVRVSGRGSPGENGAPGYDGFGRHDSDGKEPG